ncbi:MULTISPECIES: hypothetical protein [Flavobacterium]|uniref:hypothetical protein n=1 Tax=Flavobacterium TaxID=237 RepID=UPI001FCB211F|nr:MULTISPECIES: hypothetical protein [Flavobacterium]UOK42106.1 hypothetical protein LZF87_12405 [Flavobacterium enshiense]UOK42152.1 hypothetical protein LZF87_12640 [Flavobacterium enshiense]
MERNAIILIILFFTKISFAQNLDFDEIKFKGLSLYSSKNQIIEQLGNPKKEYISNYECGDFSSEEQGATYYSLDYGSVKFTGNQNEKYVIDKVDFENDKSLILHYQKHKLTCETTLNELVEIFGKQIIELIGSESNGAFIIQHSEYDNGIRFEIKNGKLITFEYWSPC